MICDECMRPIMPGDQVAQGRGGETLHYSCFKHLQSRGKITQLEECSVCGNRFKEINKPCRECGQPFIWTP